MSTLLPPAKLVHKYWSNITSYEKIGQEFRKHLIELCETAPDHCVLDVGCGIGRIAVPLTEYLSSLGQYEGFDIIPIGIKWCSENITPRFPNFHFQVADVYNRKYNLRGKQNAVDFVFPYGCEWFDSVILTSVFTHMRQNAVQRYLQEIARCMRLGARCLITWYVLNNDARELMKSKNSLFNFHHELEGLYTTNPDLPDAAIAFNQHDVHDMYEKSGLHILDIHHGFWCDTDLKTERLSSQDVIVAERK